MNAYIALANEFKKRNNTKKIGSIVGHVMSELPDLKISILNDQIILSAEQLYITDLLFKDEVDPLKKDDFVMLVPSGSGQEFFIVDRVRKVI